MIGKRSVSWASHRNVSEARNGKVVPESSYSDTGNLLRQIGSSRVTGRESLVEESVLCHPSVGGSPDARPVY